MNDINKKVKDLTLMLLYLTSWEDKEPGFECRRSWKGYDFDILTLNEQISNKNASKCPYNGRFQRYFYNFILIKL